MANRLSLRLNAAKKLLLAGVASLLVAAPVCAGLLTSPPAIAQAQSDAPHAGTEAALRRQVEGWEKKQPALADLTPDMVRLTRQQQTGIQKSIDGWGALKSIAFREVSANGWDVYTVVFDNATTVWEIAPLTSDDKIGGMLFNTALVRTDNGPAPGTEDALRRNYNGQRTGNIAYDMMAPEMAAATKQQLAALAEDTKNLGGLQSLAFQRITPRGWDRYAARYDHGTAIWEIAPLTDGKIGGLWWSGIRVTDARPHPDREAALWRKIQGLMAGDPDYDAMTPQAAIAARQQLPDIMVAMKSLGALQSVNFEYGGAGGSDVYLATFQRGRQEWNMGPLTADGKIASSWVRKLP